MEPSTPLTCEICSRSSSDRSPFYCITCARTLLYQPRLEQAHALLHKEALGKEVARALDKGDGLLKSSPKKASSQKTHDGMAARVAVERARSQRAEAEQQTQLLRAETESLWSETKRLKIAVAEKEKRIARRRAAHGTAVKDLSQRESQAAVPLQNEITTVEGRWDQVHELTAEARMLLCREAASLYNLQQRKRRKGTPGRDVYYMGGVPIIDLRDLNSTPTFLPSPSFPLKSPSGADPAHVNVSTGYLAHILHLTSHYLSLRLPAELLLPTPAQPAPVIRTPLASYKAPTLPAGLRAAAAASSSPTPHHHPRDRVLRLDKPLPQLAAEDARAYGLFVDAVTLLAWDAAWLARAQGLDVGARSWEELCHVGRTLWVLFGQSPPSPTPTPPPSEPSTRAPPLPSSPPRQSPRPAFARVATLAKTTETAKAPAPAGKQAAAEVAAAPGRGQLAHGTARAFLPAAASMGGGAEWMRGWRYASHARVIERIKGALGSERMGAEWEVLEKDEWEEAEGGGGEDGKSGDAAKAVAPAAGRARDTGEGEGSARAKETEREKAKKGWTKIRNPAGSEI